MEKTATFTIGAELLKESELGVAFAGEEYRNPLLTWIKLLFTDDQPNSNKQGVNQKEFPNLIRSISYMPIKANYNDKEGLGGHDGAVQIGVLKAGQQEANAVVAVGALYNDEFAEITEFIRSEFTNGNSVRFSWELRYKDEEVDTAGVTWLKGVTTKAVTAVKNPAYNDRTPLISISSLLESIDRELVNRGVSLSEKTKKRE